MMTSGSEDGVALTAAPHPAAPWYKRLWWRLRYGSGPRLNEQTLEEVLIGIKKGPVRITPKYMFVPVATVQAVADEMGITFEEAQKHLWDVAQKLMKGTKDD